MLFVGLGAILVFAIGFTIFAIAKVTRSDDDGYEPIE
jgi:hypothetical protein